MSDKDLLEMAAKAACIQIGAYAEQIDSYYSEWDGQSAYELTTGGYWNPLIDDGDALRLAVRLNIEFACFDDSQKVNAGVWSEDSKPYDCMTPYNGDKQAATRRAIVRAAAEIGKSMQP